MRKKSDKCKRYKYYNKLLLFLFFLILSSCFFTQKKKDFDTIQLSFIKVDNNKVNVDKLNKNIIKDKVIIKEDIKGNKNLKEDKKEKEKNKNLKNNIIQPKKSSLKKKTNEVKEKTKEVVKYDIISSQDELNKIKIINKKYKLTKGKYKISHNIKIEPRGILVISPGTTLIFEESKIICYGRFKALGEKDNMIVFKGPDGWEGIAILGKKGIGEFKYCKILDGIGIGGKIDKEGKFILDDEDNDSFGTILFANNSNGKIENCNFFQNSGLGSLSLINTKGINIYKSQFSNNEMNGIIVINSQNIELIENKILKNKYNGLTIINSLQCLIKDNDIRENIQNGINIDYKKKDEIENIESKEKISIISNKIIKNNNGILVNNGKVKIEGNYILRNKNMGIGCGEQSEDEIINNKIAANKVGIYLKNFSISKIIKNKLYINLVSIALFESSNAEVIENEFKVTQLAFFIGNEEVEISERENKFIECKLKYKYRNRKK